MTKPNVVFVLTDDQGYGDLGCHGNPHVMTPFLDKFQAQSISFSNFHVGPTCAPTRSGLFTGHHANSTGVWHTVGGRSLLRGNETTIAKVFAENGYATGLFGKWHLGDNYPYRPEDRGFQEVVTHGGGGISQAPDWWGNDYFDDVYRVNGNPRRFKGYCTDVWFSEAKKFMEKNQKNPFLCFVTPNAPHSPYNVEKKYSDLYAGRVGSEDRERFYGMISNLDENFEMIFKKILELGLDQNTITIFMTDNGTSCGGAGLHNAGLRGMKGSPYDGGHRVPFFIHFPNGKFVSPREIDSLVAHVDFMPTLMDLCGMDIDSYSHLNFHGKSLKPLLTQENPDWSERYLVTDSQRLPNPVKWRQSAVMSQQWRLINGKELYDIQSDRGQEKDVSSQHPQVVSQLREEYEKWWALVSKQIDEEIPISIGMNEETVCLRSHDWRHPDNPKPTDPDVAEDNDYLVWNQAQVRQGVGKNGYFEIKVEETGIYEFQLRRWPAEESRPITAGIEETREGWSPEWIQEKNHQWYSGGRALSIAKAHLKVGSQQWTNSVSDHDRSSIFQVKLEKGDVHLSAWFTGSGLHRGAYYVSAKRISLD